MDLIAASSSKAPAGLPEKIFVAKASTWYNVNDFMSFGLGKIS
jgi:hypothetical protein